MSLPALVDCLRGALPSAALRYRAELISRDRAGGENRIELDLAIGSAAQGRSLRLRALAPADLAGSSYLLQRRDAQSQIFVYLPSQPAVRPLSPGQDLLLFGSDLPASLLFGLLLNFEQHAISAGDTVQIDGEPLRRLYLSPPAGAPPHRVINLLVAEAPCQIRHASVETNGQIERILHLPDGGLASASGSLQVENPREQTWTELRYQRQTRDQPTPDGLFDARRFFLAKPD